MTHCITTSSLPPLATDYNALVAFAANALKTHAAREATTTTAKATTTTTTTAKATAMHAKNDIGDDGSDSDVDGTYSADIGGGVDDGVDDGDDDDNNENDNDDNNNDNDVTIHPSVADLNPVCLFVQQHLILFSIDTLLSTHHPNGSPLSPNITTISTIEHKVGLTRNIFRLIDVDGNDVKDGKDVTDVSDRKTSSGDNFTNTQSTHVPVQEEEGNLASTWPVEIQHLLEFRRIIDR